MKVVLIQPPDPPQAITPLESPEMSLFAPPWELMSLCTYLRERTRHDCSIIDCRLFSDLEQELVSAIEAVGTPDAAVIRTNSLALGEATAILDIIDRRFTDIVTALSGQHPSQFPHKIQDVPRVDFGLAGDPEPILRNLLDYMDVPQRLRRVPGLVIPNEEPATPYWLENLKALSLPDWKKVFWPPYQIGKSSTCRAMIRISRGHTHCPADRAFGNIHEPLRFWPFDRLALHVQKCGHLGVSEVFVSDPPGIWTPQRLDEWCVALRRERNIQPWAFQLLPTHLGDDTIDQLRATLCRRVEFIIPSSDPEVMKQYGCVVPARELNFTLEALERAGIHTHTRFWLGGPEGKRGETERILRMIRHMGYRSFSLHGFPLVLDSPLYHAYMEASATHINDWVQWAVDPWLHDRPVAVWGGEETAERIDQAITRIERTVQHDPKRVISRVLRKILTRNWIRYMEDKAIHMITSHGGK